MGVWSPTNLPQHPPPNILPPQGALLRVMLREGEEPGAILVVPSKEAIADVAAGMFDEMFSDVVGKVRSHVRCLVLRSCLAWAYAVSFLLPRLRRAVCDLTSDGAHIGIHSHPHPSLDLEQPAQNNP